MLDLKLALTPRAANLDAGWSFDNHVALQRQKEELEEKLERTEREIEDIEAQATWFTLQLPDAENNPKLTTLFFKKLTRREILW